MDCSKAGEAMMKYADKKIMPAVSAELASHVLKCESCREYFLALDEALEIEIVEAPDNFTSSVTAKVMKLPAYKQESVSRSDVIVRVFWGISAVLLGATFYLMYNVETVTEFLVRNPGVSSAINFVGGIFRYLTDLLQQSIFVDGYGISLGAGAASGVITLLFTLVIAGALFFIRRDENIHKPSSTVRQ